MKAPLFALLTLAACATNTSSEPLRYPALPPAPTASTQPAAFDPAPSLAVSPVVCREAELPLPNALDDDCDGRVDESPQDDALLVVLAYPQTVALSMFLAPVAQVAALPHAHDGGAAQDVEQPISPTDCPTDAAYCTIQLATGKLPRGRHRLVARRADADATSPPAAVVVSIQSRGKVTTYLARIESGASELPLGELALP